MIRGYNNISESSSKRYTLTNPLYPLFACIHRITTPNFGTQAHNRGAYFFPHWAEIEALTMLCVVTISIKRVYATPAALRNKMSTALPRAYIPGPTEQNEKKNGCMIVR